MRRILPLVLVSCLAACQARPLRGSEVTEDRPSLEAARSALTEGQAGTALAIAHGVLSQQPDNVAALTQAGDAEAALGDRLSADTSYKRALSLAPHTIRARLGLAKMQIRDDVAAAERSLRAVVADAPHDPMVLNDLGYVLDLQARHKAAQDVYVEALTYDPNRLSVRVNLALSLALSGQADRAEQMLHDLSANANATAKVRFDLALAQVIAGHDEDAAKTMSGDVSPGEMKSAIDGMAQFRQAQK